jgi:membrane protease YdiL (CAAX protease family)
LIYNFVYKERDQRTNRAQDRQSKCRIVPSQASNLLMSGCMSVVVSSPEREVTRQARRENRDAARGLALGVALIGAGLSKILCSQFGSHPGVWLPLTETIFLLCLAAFFAKLNRLEKLSGFILAIAAANFAWRVAVPWIEASSVVHTFSQHLSWAGQFFLSRVIRTIGAVLMLLTLIGSGIGARDLLLRQGNWRAPVQPERFLPFRRRISWAQFTVIILLLFGVLLPLFLFYTLRPQIGRIHFFISALPWAIATSALNAANEEFQFRSVLLARLRNVVPSTESTLLVAAFFGLSHYFGQPAGWAGVIMAGIAGWIWAKSMIETRGFTCAFLIHFVQDFVIFAFLAMSGASFPKG